MISHDVNEMNSLIARALQIATGVVTKKVMPTFVVTRSTPTSGGL